MKTFLQLTILLILVLTLQGAVLRASDINQAGLVVRLDDGTVLTRCVSFSADQISGVALLEQSGLASEISTDPSFGAFVCQIDRTGCPAEDCLCAFPPSYWRYWLRADDRWQSSPVGASSRILRDGDVDGWTWGGDESTTPPLLPFVDICPSTAVPPVYVPMIQARGV